MPVEVPAAASQPVPQAAQKSDGKGSNNITAASLHAMLVQGANASEATAKDEAAAPDAPQEGVPEVPQEQPKAEDAQAPAEAEEAPVEAKDSDAEEESSFKDTKLTPEQQAKIDKRIGKEVAKRKSEAEARAAAETKAAALEARLAELEKAPLQPPVVQTPTPDSPLADINDRKALDARYNETKEIKRWAEDALDRDDIDSGVKVGDKTLSKTEVKSILRNASRALEEHIPQRAQFLAAREAADQRARSVFSWMTDKSSAEYQAAQSALREYPWLSNLPDAHEIIGIQILGRQKLAEMQAAKAKPAAPVAKPKPPGSQTSVSSTGTPTRTSEDTVNRAKISAEIQSMKSTKKNFSASDAVALLKKSQALNSR